jgi:hypothetical protein
MSDSVCPQFACPLPQTQSALPDYVFFPSFVNLNQSSTQPRTKPLWEGSGPGCDFLLFRSVIRFCFPLSFLLVNLLIFMTTRFSFVL